MILDKLNAERKAHNIRPLKASKKCRLAAVFHARDMAKRHYFSHDTKGGVSWDRRIRRFGIGPRATIGENIAWGQDSETEVMQAWMNSPGHRANILNPDYRYVGEGRSGPYWVTDFRG